MPLERLNRDGDSLLIDADPERVWPEYRCVEVFDNKGMEKENPVEHLERFVLFLEQSARKYSVICMRQVFDEDGEDRDESPNVFEHETSLDESELDNLPVLLALKRPKILTFFNTAIRQPRISENLLTGETEISDSERLDALDYAKAAVATCKAAGIPVPASLMQRLKAALAR